MSFPKQNSGFTLIEALVYLAVSSVLLVVVTSLGFNILTNKQKVLAQEEVMKNAHLVFTRISQHLRNAQDIILPESEGGELSLEMKDSQFTPTRIYADAGTIFISQGAGGGVPLTNDDVNAVLLNFKRLTNGTLGESVKITLSLSTPSNLASSTLTTSFSLR